MKTAFKRNILILCAATLIIALASLAKSAADLGIRNPVKVLMYHDICENEADCNSLRVTADKLEGDLRWLFENGYTAILPKDLLDPDFVIPQKAVMITFDDGYLSGYTELMPLLEKYKMKANINVIVKLIEEDQYTSFLNFDRLLEMEEAGLIEIGSHSYNLHNPETSGELIANGANGVQKKKGESDEEYKARVLDDLALSSEILSKKLSRKINCFAYPYGAADRYSKKTVKELFPVSFSTKPGIKDLSFDTFFIPRYSVGQNTKLSDILK